MPGDLVGADRRADAAAADRHAALDLSRHHRLAERNDEVGIVVVRIQRVRAEVDDLVARGPQTRDRALLSEPNPP